MTTGIDCRSSQPSRSSSTSAADEKGWFRFQRLYDLARSVLRDEVFWDTLLRTVVFTIANVGLTIVLGTFIALLLVQVSTFVRVLLTTGLVLVWAMPVVVAVQVWYWMTNFQNGVLNYILTQLQLGDFSQHDWYATTFSKLSMVTLLMVWGAIPFVTISVYAGLAQVPRELVEAANDAGGTVDAELPGSFDGLPRPPDSSSPRPSTKYAPRPIRSAAW